jgi:ketosteroid isomerase-like protein
VSEVLTWDAPDDDHPARRACQASMTAVAQGRKDDWLALFAPDALVEDPVGPSMLDPEGKGHRGRDGIAAFWDANFGAVSRFHFLVRDSFAGGPSCANVATITMWLGGNVPEDNGPAGAGGPTMKVDMVAIYTVDDGGKITSLRAHWEPDRAMATITGP